MHCREVNLEQGMPPADRAIRRLTYELHSSRDLGYGAVKLIHGYGSSGAGGKIRTEARQYLSGLLRRGQIEGVVTGEHFSIFDETSRALLLRCPELRKDRDLDRHNNGVTFVLLKRKT